MRSFFRLQFYLPWPRYFFLALFRDVAEYMLCCPLPCLVFFGFDSILFPVFHVTAIIFCYPANTFGDPAATDVQPPKPSPTLPQPLPFTKTVELPLLIEAE